MTASSSAMRAELPAVERVASASGAIPIGAAELDALPPRFDALPFAEAARRRCCLLSGAQPVLVVTDPGDDDLLAWATSRFGAFDLRWASDPAFDSWLARAEAGVSALATGGIAEAPAALLEVLPAGESLSLQSIDADASPAIRFVNSTLYDALRSGASDVHLEGDPGGLTVRFRIDGVLSPIRRLESAELATQSISRIKVMAQLDIAERRVPQDGRLQIVFQRRSIDVRVSVMPSLHGEDAVLRILDRQHLAQSLAGLTLAKLGFDAPMQSALRALCRRPHGMLLVTGPTGSGKTTTLYAAIAETHEPRDKIITIEDPVEYQLPGVLQIPVNEKKGLTFARGLRSILRHDPDKILVGEIRDAETAQIAVQSALTGHLVFTTVHANTVFDVVGRFEQFGIDAYTLSSAVNGVLAQRLLRRRCAACTGVPGCAGLPQHRLCGPLRVGRAAVDDGGAQGPGRATRSPCRDPGRGHALRLAQPPGAGRGGGGCRPDDSRGGGTCGRLTPDAAATSSVPAPMRWSCGSAKRTGLRLRASHPLPRRGSLYDAHGLVGALGALGGQVGGRHALLVLESAYAPVQLVDTGGGLASTSALNALLRHRLDLAYGGPGIDIATWKLRTDHRFGQRHALAYALPKSVESAIREAMQEFHLDFKAWVPALAWSLGRFRPWRSWPKRSGWWAWAEQDRRLLAYVTNGRVQLLNPASRTDGSVPGVRRAIAFERARSGLHSASCAIGIGRWSSDGFVQQLDAPAQAAAR